jgi:hypothetical protein
MAVTPPFPDQGLRPVDAQKGISKLFFMRLKNLLVVIAQKNGIRIWKIRSVGMERQKKRKVFTC